MIMFSNCNNIDEVEEEYGYEKRKINKQLEYINELKYQIRRDNEEELDKHQYMKDKYELISESTNKLMGILENFEAESKDYLKFYENKLEEEKIDLKKAYKSKLESIQDQN